MQVGRDLWGFLIQNPAQSSSSWSRLFIMCLVRFRVSPWMEICSISFSIWLSVKLHHQWTFFPYIKSAFPMFHLVSVASFSSIGHIWEPSDSIPLHPSLGGWSLWSPAFSRLESLSLQGMCPEHPAGPPLGLLMFGNDSQCQALWTGWLMAALTCVLPCAFGTSKEVTPETALRGH